MGILVRDNEGCLVNCFTCNFRSPSLVLLFERIAEGDAQYADLVRQAREIEEVDIELLGDHLEYRMWRPEGDVGYAVLEDSHLDQFRSAYHPYLGKRGLSKSSAKRWGFLFDESRKRVVIPVRDRDGVLVGAVGRAIFANQEPKYTNYWNFDKGRFLLGAHLVKPHQRVVLVEGALDAPIAWQNLGPELQEDYAVVASMGAQLTRKQADQLVDLGVEVVLALDNDRPGQHMANAVIQTVSHRTLVRVVTYPEGKKDPADCGEAIREMVEQAHMRLL